MLVCVGVCVCGIGRQLVQLSAERGLNARTLTEQSSAALPSLAASVTAAGRAAAAAAGAAGVVLNEPVSPANYTVPGLVCLLSRPPPLS